MMVVALLQASPKNGVETMDGIEAMTRGWWRPSPGSVYPLLEQLEGEGLVRKRDDGRYELTAKAEVELEVSFGTKFRKPQSVDEMMNEMHGFVSYFEDLSSSGKPGLEPHRDRIRGLAKRLSDLVRKEESETETA